MAMPRLSRRRILSKQKPLGVDRSGYGKIKGYVIAEEGPFKSEGRGEFDKAGIAAIVGIINGSLKGVKSRLGHPTESDDGVGKHLGRVRDAYVDVLDDGRAAARGTLFFHKSAHETPSGNLAKYVMDRTEEDSDAISSSVVISHEEVFRIDGSGARLTAEDGSPLPPLWKPLHIWASDVVDTGDAVDGILSCDSLYERAASMLNKLFDEGTEREVIEQRVHEYLHKYLNRRYDSTTECHFEVAKKLQEDADVIADLVREKAIAEQKISEAEDVIEAAEEEIEQQQKLLRLKVNQILWACRHKGY